MEKSKEFFKPVQHLSAKKMRQGLGIARTVINWWTSLQFCEGTFGIIITRFTSFVIYIPKKMNFWQKKPGGPNRVERSSYVATLLTRNMVLHPGQSLTLICSLTCCPCTLRAKPLMLCFFLLYLTFGLDPNVVAFNTLNTSYTIITYDYVQTAFAYIVVLPFLYIIRVSIGTCQTGCHGWSS
jgi:hypothetical protein